MLLVFALAAALCLQVFVLSDKLSARNEARDRAVTAVQNTAESLKLRRGDMEAHAQNFGGVYDGSCWRQGYDAQWQPTDLSRAEYTVTATPVDMGIATAGGAQISACTAKGDTLFTLTAAWQKEGAE